MKEYLFTSQRLGFRNWTDEDIEPMAAINADPVVMEFFPSVKSTEETATFIQKMQKQLAEKGFCYYAVDKLDNGQLIGFIGISVQEFEAPFTPCDDIGWRLAKEEWNKGYATEGAMRCLQYGFNELGLQTIYSMAPAVNTKSALIMQKIGMLKIGEFVHPLLANDKRLQHCVLYVANK